MARAGLLLRMLICMAYLAAACTGCALSLAAVNPRPNIDLPQSQRKLALEIDETIKEDFSIPSQNGILGADFSGFRTSLRRGFKAGFEDAFELADGEETDMTLVLVEVEPSFSMTAVGVNQYGGAVGAAAAAAQLRFKARLTDADGKILARSNGTVRAKNSFTNRWEAEESLRQAMETMYEKIAAELLAEVGDDDR